MALMDPNLRDRLLGLPWFVNCGNAAAAAVLLGAHPDWGHLADAGPALSSLTSAQSGDNDLAIFNALRAELSKRDNLDSRRWNGLAEEVREFTRGTLAPLWRAALKPHGLHEDRVVSRVEWHVLGLFQEADHRKQLRSPVNTQVYGAIYQAGCLPCGWNGRWPRAQPLFH